MARAGGRCRRGRCGRRHGRHFARQVLETELFEAEEAGERYNYCSRVSVCCIGAFLVKLPAVKVVVGLAWESLETAAGGRQGLLVSGSAVVSEGRD